MPHKPQRSCRAPGCRNLTNDRYCTEHQHLVEAERKQRHLIYDRQKRDKQAATFYHSSEWEASRQEALIRDHGLCLDCLLQRTITPADLVDHIIPIRQRWDLRLTLTNLRSLCNQHHAIKTAADKIKYKG